MNVRHRPRDARVRLVRAVAAAAAAWSLCLPWAGAQTPDTPAPTPTPQTATPPPSAATDPGRAAPAAPADVTAVQRRGMPITRAEDRLLPTECLYTNSTPHSLARPDLYAALVQRYGEGWTHMHHYCTALRLSLDYHRRGHSPQRRASIGNRMIGELDYVIRNSPPEFGLLPVVIARKIDYLTLMGRTREAFETAVELTERFPDLAEGHARLAMMMRRAGRTAEADAVLTRARGVVANPAELDAAVQRLTALN